MEFRHNGRDTQRATYNGGVTLGAVPTQLVERRADPAIAARTLDLPADPTAMTLEQVDQLIAYNDALDKRYHQALARLHAVRDQIHAALRQYGGEVLADLRSTDAAPLRDAFSRALAEYDSCRRQVEAIGAYVEQLDDEPARQQ